MLLVLCMYVFCTVFCWLCDMSVCLSLLLGNWLFVSNWFSSRFSNANHKVFPDFISILKLTGVPIREHFFWWHFEWPPVCFYLGCYWTQVSQPLYPARLTALDLHELGSFTPNHWSGGTRLFYSLAKLHLYQFLCYHIRPPGWQYSLGQTLIQRVLPPGGQFVK